MILDFDYEDKEFDINIEDMTEYSGSVNEFVPRLLEKISQGGTTFTENNLISLCWELEFNTEDGNSIMEQLVKEKIVNKRYYDAYDKISYSESKEGEYTHIYYNIIPEKLNIEELMK